MTYVILITPSGTPSTNSPNEALIHKGKVITNLTEKSNAFAQHYAAVSRHQLSKEDREFRTQFLKKVKAPTVEDESTSPLKMQELKRAIKQARAKGQYGPDEIPPTFLKALGPLALAELLEIFNLSFRHADCPRVWRVATIIPLLKAGKPASEIASFRPVSLTSCVAKLLERILADRLYHLAETNNMFSKFQA